MNVRDFLRLPEHGISVPIYALNFIKKIGRGKPLAQAKMFFGDESRVDLLVEYPVTPDYQENLSLQDAMEIGRFFEKDRKFEVLYIEHVPVLWYMKLMLHRNGSGSIQIIKDKVVDKEVEFMDYLLLQDIYVRSMCRFGERLIGLKDRCTFIEATIGWTGWFFGEPPSRFLVKDYKL